MKLTTAWIAGRTLLESATLISATGYFWQKYVSEPRQEIQRLISEIDVDLIFFANVWANPGSTPQEIILTAHNAFRHHAASLRAKLRILSMGRYFSLFGLPSIANIREASSLLIGLSSSLGVNSVQSLPETALSNKRDETKIRMLLNISEAGT